MPPLRSELMSRSTCLSDGDVMSAIKRFITSAKAIFSISRLDARRTNMMTSPVGGLRSQLRPFLTESTSRPILSNAVRISSWEYAFCSPLTICPLACLTLYLNICRCPRSWSAKPCFSDRDWTFFSAVRLLGAYTVPCTDCPLVETPANRNSAMEAGGVGPGYRPGVGCS